MSLQVQSLLKVFETLDIEERQKLLPILTEKAGIFDRQNINNVSDEKEREFIKFIFCQTLASVLKLQYIRKCQDLMQEIKKSTIKGTVRKYSDTYYYYLYQNSEKGGFKNVKDEEVSKEEFFDWMLFQNNNSHQLIRVVKIDETVRIVSQLFCDML